MFSFFRKWLAKRRNNRLLLQRNAAREAGDKLAQAVFKKQDKSLFPALSKYCKATGWGGPAMSWLTKLFIYEECILCGENLPWIRIDQDELCKGCKRHPKI